MKAEWSHVEKYRINDGIFSSPAGAHFGAFRIPHPEKGRFLFEVIATDGKQGGDDWEHVSIKVADFNGTTRIPGWQEMDYVKSLFWEPDEIVVQYHVNEEGQKVDVHPHVLHLWRHPTRQFPVPNKVFV